ncbi:MAG TPA: cell division protein ZapE, partial [Gallionella sp.]|nr:cell division protein ZapE [Gallionella sp.]
SPKAWYQAASASPDFVPDAAQAAAIEELDVLWHQLVEFKSKRNQFLGRSLLSPAVPRGLYLWGGVGRGKTLLMDAFYASLPYRRKRRIHFHNFMAEVHREMKALAGEDDPLIALADNLAKSTRLLCLDEFHVDDIADAMILGRLIAALFERGVVLMTTSNIPPDNLYAHGLQRKNFLPVIALLKRELKVMHIENGSDYRLRALTREPLFLVAKNEPGAADNEARMASLFDKIAGQSPQDDTHIEVLGRRIPVKRVAHNVVWLDFRELCGGAHSQTDYLEIAHRYPTVFVSHIPRLTEDFASEARRFTWLIDVFYDNHVRLVATSAVRLEDVFTDDMAAGEFSRTASRLTEMQTLHYLKQLHHSQRVTLNGDV